MAPADPILKIAEEYKNDKNPNKVNLGIGAYRDDEGLPYIFPEVLEIEKKLLSMMEQGKINKEYLPILGD